MRKKISDSKSYLDVFESPIRITGCGHNFCHKCLVDVSKKKFRKVKGKNEGKEGWLCPDCRKFHDSQINSLPRNYQLENLAEKFQKKAKLPDIDSPFGTCEIHKREIEFRKLEKYYLNDLNQTLECLFHGKDICADCLLEKRCGSSSSFLLQTTDCNFMKKSDLKKLADDHTAEIQGIGSDLSTKCILWYCSR